MTPTTKLAHPFHCLLERGGERLTASFSNFVVADHRSDHAVRAAIPFADVEGGPGWSYSDVIIRVARG